MRLPIITDDPWLEPYEHEIVDRLSRFESALRQIRQESGSLLEFAHAHQNFGFHYDPSRRGWFYREWAPRADALFLIGDFNDWDRAAHPLLRNDNGTWEIFLPDSEDGRPVLMHSDRVKVHVVGANGAHDRIPPYICRAVQDEESKDFSGQIWAPEPEFAWSDRAFDTGNIREPLIYECHLGMAQEAEKVGSYVEFTENVLPRISALGYNCIQMMAIQEHPYYGSFGYHVSNFFAPSSRFGTPEELKALINAAHQRGIAVLLDLVHSHAVKNFAEGLAQFDGEDGLYFHTGGRGFHDQWDSRLFDYGKQEVKQFLLSNLAYWLEEFHFDGFRFDGVTSMLYHHHGDFVAFDHYDKYFKEGVEWDAVTYLQLANTLIHELKPGAITIAEDMSGMPGSCRTVSDGGIGFDYRLGMGLPDNWIKLLKHARDEDWDLHELWGTLANRRYKEKTIAYAESHDQALVGDKSLAFWLMDKEMYWHMQVEDANPIIARGLALHKMIRLITLSAGGEGYLNFIGNEFGHPEWIDFPREGNDWSYKFARRQWSLVDNPKLKYKFLNEFDRAMIHLAAESGILGAAPAKQLNVDTDNKVLIFERGGLLFLFNFHPDRSIPDYRFGAPEDGVYGVALCSDDPEFGGFGRVAGIPYAVDDARMLSIYAPCRTAIVLAKNAK